MSGAAGAGRIRMRFARSKRRGASRFSTGRCALRSLGGPNAGKSTLVNALIGEDRMITGPEPGLTRDSVSTDVTIDGRDLRLFDTAGLRRKAKIHDKAEKLSVSDTIRAIRFSEVVVLLIDAERGIEHQDLTIADMVVKEGRALVIAVNKWDVVTEKQAQLKVLREALKERLAQVPGIKLVTISALAEKGLEGLTRAIFETYELWNRRVSTPALKPMASGSVGSPRTTGCCRTSDKDPIYYAAIGSTADVYRNFARVRSRCLRATYVT